MDTKLKKLLETSKIKYKLTEHRKVYTAFNAAETQHIKPKEVAKTVLLKLAKKSNLPNYDSAEFVMVVIPSQKYVDFKKVDKLLFDAQTKHYKTLVKTEPKTAKPVKTKCSMAKEKDITSKLKSKVGLLTPFSSLFSVPVLLDKALSKNKSIILPAGSYTDSITLPVSAYLKLENPLLGNFSK
jgi:Ala-tRNA(Pro) deacylase